MNSRLKISIFPVFLVSLFFSSQYLVLSCSKISKVIDVFQMIDIDVKDKGKVLTSFELSEFAQDVFRLDLDIYPSVGSAVLSLTLSFDTEFGSNATFFIPSIWILGNKFSSGVYREREDTTRWIFREDRTSVPCVFATDGKKAVAVFKLPARFDLSQDPEIKRGGPQDTDIWGLGFDKATGKIIYTFPFQEHPFIYRRKFISSFITLEPSENLFILRERKRTTFFIVFLDGNIPDMLSKLWLIVYDVYMKEGILEIADVNYIYNEALRPALRNTVEYFRKYFHSDEISGFFSFVKTEGGGVFLPFIEAGFTGMAVMNAANSIFIGKRYGYPEFVSMGHQVINSWIEKGVRNKFFIDCFDTSRKDVCHFPPVFFADSFFTRRNFETLLGILLAYSYDPSSEIWKEVFISGVEAMMNIQLDDGTFARRYDFQGRVLDNSPSGTLFAVIPLLKAYKMTGDSRFLNSATKAGEILNGFAERFEYYGSTIDANSEDKEAAMWVFMSCAYLFHHTGDTKWKICAQRSLYASLWWVFLWNVPFSPEQKFFFIDIKTQGLSSVSVENIHVDVYLFFFPSFALNFASNLPANEEIRIRNMVYLMVSSALQVVPSQTDQKGASYGIIPEVIQQTWWDYGFGGKGNYNATSATGWTVASVFQAIKNLFFGDDFF